jgi:hypothetical protein
MCRRPRERRGVEGRILRSRLQPVVGRRRRPLRATNSSWGFGSPDMVHQSKARWAKGKRPEGRFPSTARLFLQSKLAVGWLPPPLAVRLGSFLALEVFGNGAEFVDVAAGETGAVRSVPVFLQDHRAAAAWTDSGRSCLHDFLIPPLDRVTQGLAPAWKQEPAGDTKRPPASNHRRGLSCAYGVS